MDDEITVELDEESRVACPLCEEGDLMMESYNYLMGDEDRLRVKLTFQCDTCEGHAEMIGHEGGYITVAPKEE